MASNKKKEETTSTSKYQGLKDAYTNAVTKLKGATNAFNQDAQVGMQNVNNFSQRIGGAVDKFNSGLANLGNTINSGLNKGVQTIQKAYEPVVQSFNNSLQPKEIVKENTDITKTNEYNNIVNERTSALSNLNAANMQALKYADTAAQAGGYSTQGAAMQNVGNLQGAYLNQIGGVNKTFQDNVANLSDKYAAIDEANYKEAVANQKLDSNNALSEYRAAVASAVENGNYTPEKAAQLKQQFYPYLVGLDRTSADSFGSEANYQQQQLDKQTAEAKATELQEKGIDAQGNDTKNYIYKNDKGVKYDSNLDQLKGGGNNNMNFHVEVGESKYKVELGKRVENSKELSSLSLLSGQIVLFNGYLITKDKDGDVRYVKSRSGYPDDLNKLAKALGYDKVGDTYKEAMGKVENIKLY